MPRQIRDVCLQTREARQKLAPAKEPYWREIRRGLHVGYYKGRGTSTWWLREIRDGRRAKRRVGLAEARKNARRAARHRIGHLHRFIAEGINIA
jgi:hypothetical protein